VHLDNLSPLIRSKKHLMNVGMAQPVTETLTKREMQIMLLICDGKSSRQIAETLGITFKTAACHRTRIMEKIGVHEIASLVRFAVRNGFVVA
jgi:DNA-binding NarL/FixJ family response regulator